MSENWTFLPTWTLSISHFSTMTTTLAPSPSALLCPSPPTHTHKGLLISIVSALEMLMLSWKGTKWRACLLYSGGPHTNRYHWSVHHHMFVKPISVMGAGERPEISPVSWSCSKLVLRWPSEWRLHLTLEESLSIEHKHQSRTIPCGHSLVGALFSRLTLLNMMCPGETLVQGNKVSYYVFNI